MKHDDEFISISAAYTLGKQGMPGIKILLSLMQFNDGINVDDARCFIDEGQKSELEMICRNSIEDKNYWGWQRFQPSN